MGCSYLPGGKVIKPAQVMVPGMSSAQLKLQLYDGEGRAGLEFIPDHLFTRLGQRKYLSSNT